MNYEKKLNALIDVIEREYSGACFETLDAVCYGSMKRAGQAGEEERAVKRILDAVPKDIMAKRKKASAAARAAQLRRQADAIEKSN